MNIFNYFTLGDFVGFGIMLIIVIIISFGILVFSEKWKCAIIAFIIGVIVIGGIGGVTYWMNTHTASGAREIKDFQSELNNGINREVTITAEDGRQIFYYEGRVDIESNHEDNYIKFESEEGKRYIVYYGVQDTITIIEK